MTVEVARLPGILATWAFRSVVVATIGVGLCWTLAYAWDDVPRWFAVTPWLVTASSLALVVAAFAAATWVGRRAAPFPPATFVAVTVAAGILLRVAYLQVVDPVWSGDFMRYWQSALALAGAGEYEVGGIYDQRALLYVPLVELFGDRPAFLQGLNVILLALAQLAGYDTLRRLHSHQAAQAFTLLWLAVVETTASAAIPSHDLSGMALIAIAFWANVVGTIDFSRQRRDAWPFLWSTILLALTLWALETLRGLGVLLLLATAAGAIIGLVVARGSDDAARRVRMRMTGTLAQVLLAYLVLALGMAAMSRAELLADSNATAMLRVTTPQVNSMSNGTYEWMRGFHDTFNKGLEAPRFADFRKSLAVSDFSERPVGFASNSFDRSARLYSLGSQYPHYFRGWIESHRAGASWLIVYNLFYAALFALFFLAALFGLLARRERGYIDFPLIFMAGLSLAFVTVLENQPRYIYPLWYVGCLAIGLQLARGLATGTPARMAIGLAGLLAQAALFIALMLGLAWGAATVFYTADDGRILSGWKLESNQPLPEAAEQRFLEALSSRPSTVVPTRHDGHFSTAFGPLALQLEFPATLEAGDTVTATRRICVSDAGERELSFQFYAPHGRAGSNGSLTLAVLKDGRQLWTRAVPAEPKPPRRVRVPLPADEDGCMQLGFRLQSHVTDQGEPWRRASRTEIFFPRIEPAGLGQ